MKFKLITALIFATLFVAPISQAKSTPPTSSCLHALKWQRWNYTKAHLNVTQSLKLHNPKRIHWTVPIKQSQCRLANSRVKALRLAENAHWNKLRLQPAGVKWIIRRAFWKFGKHVVHDALHVASCESNFLPSAFNGADTGVWQINWIHHVANYIMRSPELSTGWAYRAYIDGGYRFSPTWVCATIKGIH